MAEHPSLPQAELFAPSSRALPAPPPLPEHLAVAARLPASVRMGTTSWAYPGWSGIVYGPSVPQKDLSNHGLTAYAKHPLFRTVEIDRTYYEPVLATGLQSYASQVPEDFRFLMKAHEDCVVRQFPSHPRYGKKRGETNSRYLDAAYATDKVVGPFVEGLGAKGGALLFQFPPHAVDDPEAFAGELHAFLTRLPKGVVYAVEIRNAELFVPAYSNALEDAGAVHCHNVWTRMPTLTAQAKRISPRARRPFVLRWLLRPNDTYERANARYSPFSRVVEQDETTLTLAASILAKVHLHGIEAFVLVDNKAEGCAPESVARLARAIVDASIVPSAPSTREHPEVPSTPPNVRPR